MTAQQFWQSSVIEAERKSQQPAPVFMYRMDWETPVGGYRAGHSLETVFVFDNVENNRDLTGPGPGPQVIATQMSAAWLAFARRGDPNTPALPKWPAYNTTDRATMIFNLKSAVENDPNAEVRKILLG
jgi:para-nitrobenzyl esterase